MNTLDARNPFLGLFSQKYALTRRGKGLAARKRAGHGRAVDASARGRPRDGEQKNDDFGFQPSTE